MSAATWITAKRPSWWRTWWRRRDPDAVVASVPAEPAPETLALVGRFEDARGLSRAVAAFEAAEFPKGAVVVAGGAPCRVGSGLWSKVRERMTTSAGARASDGSLGFTQQVEPVLASGCAIVLVRCPARFQQACEIIMLCGGRIGLPINL